MHHQVHFLVDDKNLLSRRFQEDPIRILYFSSKPMASLKVDVKGCPILIDELTPTYWKYAKDIVKMNVNLIREQLINHPTFVLLSNDINNVTPEISKHIIVINLDNHLDRTAAAYNGKKINTIRKKLIIHSTANT
ncbi:MAG: hypothetical protein IJA32_12630 [Lachnospiraceae bacterium]|nr:hypothetical protein [Lachnospiraceae bacterium]